MESEARKQSEFEKGFRAAMSLVPSRWCSGEQVRDYMHQALYSLSTESDEPCGECHLKPGETCDICGRCAALAQEGE